MAKLEGKVALITGAARGQGRAHALRLAQEGADIVAVDICADIAENPYSLATAADLEETVQAVKALDRRIVAAQVDVRDAAAMEAVVRDAVAELGRLDIVVANAGISPLTKTPEDPVATWQAVIDVNLTGVFNTIQAAVPAIVAGSAGGSIVITSSAAGLKGNLTMKTIGGFGYTAAKHGVVGLMRAFANDLAEHSIRVNTVHPCGVNTAMVNNPAVGELLQSDPSAGMALVNLLPGVAMIEPEDVSAAVAWLASDEARYVTGVALPVDAGFTVK
ncbi:mycofactocin-coupled SDR family oxidoreductase [Sporichthya brevicatena]|uniref:Mycofactocin-coupled SDR family oxidoreductase n=1 Tax=Sporichthya brevicatena TaxID=171442 RepID=A0ABN1H4I6_9ACTN